MSERIPLKDLREACERAGDALPACPTAREIRRLGEGALTGERAFVVEFHLNTCAECIELMERLETPKGEFELKPAEVDRLESDIAANLGMQEQAGRTSVWRSISWLWTIRAPLFVPAAAALLLLALVWRGGLGPVGPADAPAGIQPVSSILIDQAVLRGGEGRPDSIAVAAGSTVLAEVFLEGLEHRPGDPVTFRVEDSIGAVLLTGETTVLEDYNVRLAFRLTRPGTYTLQLSTGKDDVPLESIDIEVLPGDTPGL